MSPKSPYSQAIWVSSKGWGCSGASRHRSGGGALPGGADEPLTSVQRVTWGVVGMAAAVPPGSS